MPASPSDLFAFFDAHNIAHQTHAHDATFTVEAGRHLKATLPGGHTKNLFLKDKQENLVLISAWSESTLKLNQLHKHIGTKRLSFASAEQMAKSLGVTPGSVTAFALINDKDLAVRFIVDAALMQFDILNFHPLINTATTAIGREDFERFIAATGHALTRFDFSQLS